MPRIPYSLRVVWALLAAAALSSAPGPAIAGDGMPVRGAVHRALEQGIGYLHRQQAPSGELPTFGWYASGQRRWWSLRRRWYVATPFTASQILHSLTFATGSDARRVRERAVAYLLDQREPPGVWRYYGRRRAPHPISPDVDDTAQAWAALAEQGIAVDPGAMHVLRASRTTSGVFNTWIGDPAGWIGVDSRDVNAVVNANALFLFGLMGEPPPEACRYAVRHIIDESFRRSAGYYPAPLAFTYFVSRAYADGHATCLAEAAPVVRTYARGAQQPDGGWGDALETALGLLTLLNLGETDAVVGRGIRDLVARQNVDGSWPLAALYTGAKGSIHYGSAALTTGFCVEALAKYVSRVARPGP